MTKQPTRLVTKAELLRRVNRTRPSFYRDCNGPLKKAITDSDLVDLNHIDAVNYCHKYGYEEPDAIAIANAAREQDKQAAEREREAIPQTTTGNFTAEYWPNGAPEAEYDDSDDQTAADIMRMTLEELVGRYGKQAEFVNYTRALKILTDTRAKEEDAARKRGEYIHRAHVEKVIQHVDALQVALLNESTLAIANKTRAIVKAGGEDKQIERGVHDIISRTIKGAKSTITRALRNV